MADDTTKDIEEENDPFSDIKKEIRTRFELLPPDLQKAIMDDGYQAKLFEIAKTQKLTYEELGVLEMETTMVLLGMIRPEDYRDEIQIELRKNDPEIEVLVTLVNEQVFNPLRSTLGKIYANQGATPEGAGDAALNVSPATTPAEVPVSGQTGLTNDEKSLLEKSGVILNDAPTTKTPPTVAEMPSRSDILQSIENPTKTPHTSIVSDKLTGPAVVPPTKITDYSLPKTSDTPASGISAIKKIDPYRESVE